MRTAAKDIDAYIEKQAEPVRPILGKIRQTVKKAVPGAEELVSYGMPAFKYHGVLIWFAVFNHHYSIFIRRHILTRFTQELKIFKLSDSGSAIKIPLNEPVPVRLLTKILKAAAKSNLESGKL